MRRTVLGADRGGGRGHSEGGAALNISSTRGVGSQAAAGGWLLDGFPRTPGQARAMASGGPAMLPDAVVVLDRPDDLAVDFCLGRCEDSATGDVYHPRYAPPPPDVESRLVWRTDDTEDVFRGRLATHARDIDAVLDVFEAAGRPVIRVDNARSELEAFDEICDFLDEIENAKRGPATRAARKEARISAFAAPAIYAEAQARVAGAFTKPRPEPKPASGGSANEEDVAALCYVDETQEECEKRRGEPVANRGLRDVVRRCNTYDPAQFAPVLVQGEQVGFVAAPLLHKLRGPGLSNAVEVGPNPLPHVVRRSDGEATDEDVEDVATLAVTLAPNAISREERTRVVGALVDALVADSELLLSRGAAEDEVAFVPRAKLRGRAARENRADFSREDARELGTRGAAADATRLVRGAGPRVTVGFPPARRRTPGRPRVGRAS